VSKVQDVITVNMCRPTIARTPRRRKCAEYLWLFPVACGGTIWEGQARTGATRARCDDDGITAFQVASDVEHEEVMQLLSEHGAR